MPSPGQSTLFTVFTELVSTTFRNHKSEVADNMSKHNALYRRLYKKNRLRLEDGGLSIVCILEYAENSTYTRYSGYDPLNIGASDVISAAEYPWRQVALNVAASGREIRSNKGENQIVNLVKTKIKNATKTGANGMSGDIYSTGALSEQVNGLQALVADAGTGVVGGIDSTPFTFWRNIVQSAAAPLQGGGAIVPSATTIESLMLPLYLRLSRGADEPDLIVFSEDYFTFFEMSQTALKRYAPEDEGKGGMLAMRYKNADVFHDSAASGIPAAHGYFLNTDYIEMVAHEDANWEIVPELRSTNQDAVVIPVLWQGNLACSNRSLQGVQRA